MNKGNKTMKLNENSVFNNSQNNIYPTKILDKYKKKMDEELLKFCKDTNYYTYNHYSIIGGKPYGDKFEEFIIEDIFSDMDRKDDESHDAKYKDSKGEIKVSRLSIKPKKANGKSYVDRSVTWEEFNNGTASHYNPIKWQQVKPSCYDWMICGIVCRDRIRYYFIPTDLVNPLAGKENYNYKYDIQMYSMHRHEDFKTRKEGQINYKKDLEKYFIFEDILGDENRNIKIGDLI